MFTFPIVSRVALTLSSKTEITKGWLLEMVPKRYLPVLEVDSLVWLAMKETWNEMRFHSWYQCTIQTLKVTTFVSIGTRETSNELELFKNKISLSNCLLKRKKLATSESLNTCISKTLGTVLWNSRAQLYCLLRKQTQLHVQYLHNIVLNWSEGN